MTMTMKFTVADMESFGSQIMENVEFAETTIKMKCPEITKQEESMGTKSSQPYTAKGKLLT